MGTNYYGRIIPTKKRKEELYSLIDTDDFSKIIDEIDHSYGQFKLDWEGNPTGGEVHLGKRSAGWKFLWNPNIYLVRTGHLEKTKNKDGSTTTTWIKGPNSAFYLYPLTKKGIKSFIDREDIRIFNEYDEEQDKEEFFNMAINWTTWKNEEAWDSRTYTEWELSRNPNYKEYRNTGEYIDLLINEGFKFISNSRSDFYSDGLRFATNTEFS